MSKISTQDYIALSSCVYDHGLIPQGFDLIEYCEEAGFYGAAYVWLDTNEIVIAFRGTTFTDIYDIVNDIAILFQKVVFQTRYAYSLYKHVKKIYPKATISLTGHSLGGALAQLVAVLVARDEGTGIHTETFNAPGVSEIALASWENFQEFEQFDIINYYNPCDAIGTYGQHVGIELPILPGELYKRKLNEEGWENEDPADYLIKFTNEPGAHFIAFFIEYYRVDENSFSKEEGVIDRVTQIVPDDEVWPYNNQISYGAVPDFNIDGIVVFSNKMEEIHTEKQQESYTNNYSRIWKEKFWTTNSLTSQLQQQNNKFTFKQQWFYENYDEKFKGLSKNLNLIAADMYQQSDMLMFKMSGSLFDTFTQEQEGKEENTSFPEQTNKGMPNADFASQYRYKYDSNKFSLKNRTSAQQATVNIVNNLGVNLSAISNTSWNGRQYVVDVALSEQ